MPWAIRSVRSSCLGFFVLAAVGGAWAANSGSASSDPGDAAKQAALAEAIATWFPELGGRSLAVSDAEITKENIPTLPLVMVAFTRSLAEPPMRTQATMFEILDTFVVEFWLSPARYKKANGSGTPFWSYYDYEEIRDTLLTNIAYWESPGGERVSYRGLQIEADPLAVTLTFTFLAVFRWCATVPDTHLGTTIEKIGFNLCVPEACIPPRCEEVDPCP